MSRIIKRPVTEEIGERPTTPKPRLKPDIDFDYRPMLSGCSSPEPSLRTILYHHILPHCSHEQALDYVNDYIAAIRKRGKQP